MFGGLHCGRGLRVIHCRMRFKKIVASSFKFFKISFFRGFVNFGSGATFQFVHPDIKLWILNLRYQKLQAPKAKITALDFTALSWRRTNLVVPIAIQVN